MAGMEYLPASDPEQPSFGDQASLIVSIIGMTARTLLPNIDMTPVRHVISGAGPEGANFTISTDQSAAEIDDLAPGDWMITVEAKKMPRILS